MDRVKLRELADRVEALGYIACPLCGETDFDVPGIVGHWRWDCVVERVSGLCWDNAEVAENIRAIASQEQGDA